MRRDAASSMLTLLSSVELMQRRNGITIIAGTNDSRSCTAACGDGVGRQLPVGRRDEADYYRGSGVAADSGP